MGRSRMVPNNQTILDQVDFYESDGFTRVIGIVPADLSCRVFYQNALQPWGLGSGSGVPDSRVASGQVYFLETPGALGYYGLRWRPNAVGYWRIVLGYASGTQEVTLGYDVVSASPTEPSLSPSFLKLAC